MKLLPALPIGPRLGGLLVLLMLAIGGLGLALGTQQARQQQQHLAWMETTALPSARLLHELSGHVDELRGLLALHLMLGDSAEAGPLEQQMQLRREAVALRLASFGQRLGDATERGHFDTVSASLTAYLREHERLLALSRQAARDAASAAAARQLLTGPAQLAYQRLSADLAAWSAYVEQRTDQASRQARAGIAGWPGAWLAVGLALLAAAALAWAGLVAPARASGVAGPVRGADRWADWPRRRRLVDLAGTVDRLAFEAHLLALNAAVAAAREGAAEGAAPGGREEGLRHLARRVADATSELSQLLAGGAQPGEVQPGDVPPAGARSAAAPVGASLTAGQPVAAAPAPAAAPRATARAD